MIVGLGADICDIRRIEQVIDHHQERFLKRIFTENEIAKAEKRQGKMRYGTYAKRWAAKEACAKALGTGFSENVFYRDIEVVNQANGQPSLNLYHGALKRLQILIPSPRKPNILLTMTDDYPYAFAQVILEII